MRLKHKLNTNSSDFPVMNMSVSTQATAHAWDEQPSLRKGSEQLHSRDARASLFSDADTATRLQQFESMVSACNQASAQLVSTRKRLYSHYERVSAEPERTDDYLVKYKTEICKNYEFKGRCQWGDAVSL